MTGRQVSIGLDVGGTKIASCLMDEAGTVMERHHVRTDAAGSGPAVLRQMLEVIGLLQARAGALEYGVRGVGVACPGIIDLETATVTYASNNIPGWTGTRIGEAVRERFGLPVWADNDGNAALVGELRFGGARSAPHTLMITLGTGVGGAVAVHGRILRGAHGVAGKFGHIPVSRRGPLCSCGRRGCIEAYASGPAVVRAAARDFGFTGTGEELLTLARSGDDRAIHVLRRAGEKLGVAIAAAANLLDPGLCLIAGGFAAAGDLVLGPAREVLAATLHPAIAERTRLAPAPLGSEAGLLGAAWLPWNPRVLGKAE
jgi:glucokinase